MVAFDRFGQGNFPERATEDRTEGVEGRDGEVESCIVISRVWWVSEGKGENKNVQTMNGAAYESFICKSGVKLGRAEKMCVADECVQPTGVQPTRVDCTKCQHAEIYISCAQ